MSTSDRPRGGLNLWQWIGVAIIALVLLYMLYDRLIAPDPPVPPTLDPAAPPAEVAPTRAALALPSTHV